MLLVHRLCLLTIIFVFDHVEPDVVAELVRRHLCIMHCRKNVRRFLIEFTLRY